MVTLEISSTGIRLMEVSGRRVTKWANHSVDPGIFEDEVISNPEALGATVRQLMNSSGISEGNVIASVSGLFSLSRVVTVPTPLGEQVTEKAVLEAVQEIIPIPEDELYLSWQTIATVGGSHQVLVVGVPRDVIDSEVQSLRGAGINPRTLDLKAMALARVVHRERALILNIEPTALDMVVIAGGAIDIMRTVAWQHDELSLEERVEQLVSALELTVGFYNSHHPGSPLDPDTPLFVTGQISTDLTLVERLQARLEYTIESLVPPLEYPAHLPVSQYAVNIGLALKGTAKSKSVGQGDYSMPDINLLPEAYQPWKPSRRQMQIFSTIILALVLLFPAYQVTNGAMTDTSDLKKEYTVISNKLQRMQLEIKNREPLQKTIQQYQAIVGMGGGLTDDLETITSLADMVGIRLQSVVHESKTMTITCTAESYVTFRNYITALEESGQFLSPIPPPEGYPYTKSGSIKLEPKPAE